MASRICPKCGQESPQSAKFCSQCSATLMGNQTTPYPPEPAAYKPAKAKSSVVMMSALGAGVVIVAAAAIFALNKSSSVVHAPPLSIIAAPPVVQAPTAPLGAAPPLVQAPDNNQSAPPLTQAPTAQSPSTPADVVSYLAFIQQMELTRNNLENAETAAVLPLLGTANSLKTDTDDDNSSRQNGMTQINQGMTDNVQQWQALIKQFQARTPPSDCEDLGNDYYKLLNDYTNLCSQIQVALANGDYAKVLGLQSAQTLVDTDASTADAAVAAICTKYNIKKSFVISTSSGSSGTSLLGG